MARVCRSANFQGCLWKFPNPWAVAEVIPSESFLGLLRRVEQVVAAAGSSQCGQGPPRPTRVQGWLQPRHHWRPR